MLRIFRPVRLAVAAVHQAVERRRRRVLDDDDLGAADAQRLLEQHQLPLVGDVVQDEAEHHEVEAAIGERQRLAVVEAERVVLVAADVDDVDALHAGDAARDQLVEDVAFAAADVEHRRARLEVGGQQRHRMQWSPS